MNNKNISNYFKQLSIKKKINNDSSVKFKVILLMIERD